MDRNGEDGGFEAGAMAGLALADAHETFDVLFDKFRSVGVMITTLEVRNDTFESCFVFGSGGEFSGAGDGYLIFFRAGSIEDFFDVLGF